MIPKAFYRIWFVLGVCLAIGNLFMGIRTHSLFSTFIGGLLVGQLSQTWDEL
jgi:hypothetical protein